MTNNELTALALKLFAIYLLVEMLLAIPTLIVTLGSAKDTLGTGLSELWIWVGVVAAVLIGLSTALLLWNVANRALFKVTNGTGGGGFPAIETAVFAALGIFLIIEGLISFLYVSAGAYVQYVSVEPGGVRLQAAVLMVAHFTQCLIGVSLILRTDGWLSFLYRIRNAGLSK